jgi:hypothetical protein
LARTFTDFACELLVDKTLSAVVDDYVVVD